MKIGAAFFGVILSAVACAQESAPPVLRGATHCLWAENFELGTPGSSALRVGYVIDKQSYPGQTVMYVVSYTNDQRSAGLVYTIFLTEKNGKNNFHIQNNAKFATSEDGIDFVKPPVGGADSQQHLITAIKNIERQPTFTIGVVDTFATTRTTQCESYTDKRHGY